MDLGEYYKAYDKRYKQVHEKKLMWSSNNNTKIVYESIKKYNINKNNLILEIGCGEGRDAMFLLSKGYNLLATDVSSEAIKFCKERDNKNQNSYEILDVLDCDNFKSKFDFIYSVACLHMLVYDTDRNNYYKFINEHLKNDGIALILSMGDGINENSSDPNLAWEDVVRIHQETENEMKIAATSCRVVNFETLFHEINNNKLEVIEYGITEIIPDFPKIMYVVIKRENLSN